MAFEEILKELEKENVYHQNRLPGESEKRQPVHTVYGGAHLFKSTTTGKLGELALKHLESFAPNASAFGKALGLQDSETVKGGQNLASVVYARVLEKLKREAVEDFRIDFEDGFGYRPDQEEDDTAVKAAIETAKGLKDKTLPPFLGIRIKTLSEELKARAFKTMDIYISRLVQETGGRLPDNFVVTLPKIIHPGQVAALVKAFEVLEAKLKLAPGTLKMEFMIETPQSVFDSRGHAALPGFLDAARGRCVAAHFGTYDYTASLSITAEHQTMAHPACDFAKSVMKVSLAGTGLWISDGATNVMPVGDDPKIVHRAWRLAYDHIQHSLKNAFYQGWDLHPGQLPVRYAAMYVFFMRSLDSATARLSNFIQQASKATLVGDVFDDAATGQGLLNYFLRALNCGAISEAEILATGLTSAEIRLRSFKKIIEGRKYK